MDDNNTSSTVVEKAPETGKIVDQDTLEAALANEPVTAEEPTEVKTEELKLEAKPQLVFGKYKSIDEAQNAYANIQSRATKAEQQLAEIKKAQQQESKSKIKTMDYDSQLEFLLNKVEEQDVFKQGLEAELAKFNQDASVEADKRALEDFISSNPLLNDSGMDEEFRLIATHPSMASYTLDSIFSVRIKPKLEKLMGTKITVKEKKLRPAQTKQQDTEKFKDVSRGKMSPSEFKKNEKEILRSAGVRI